MGKEKEGETNSTSSKPSSVLVNLVWSCADIKLLLTSLLFICSLATLFQFFPYSLSPPVFRYCLSHFSSTDPQFPPPFSSSLLSTTTTTTTTTNASSSSPTTSQQISIPVFRNEEKVTDTAVVKRAFNPIGSGAYLFIQMSAYRGGLNTFAVIGIASKPIHVFSNPQFLCQWIPNNSNSSSNNDSTSLNVTGTKILPDWGYGRVYTVVVVNCTFPVEINSDNSGGQLLIHATTGGGQDKFHNKVERFVALEESPMSLNASIFSSPPRYEYLYCGSPVYGDLSPQRVREWLAYHVRLFGEGKSHFVLYDAGGVHDEVMQVLQPWMERGLVTLHDVRDQERFDGYYHNQFMVVNDCLHRYRFTAKWMFFFDLDEFIYLEKRVRLNLLLDSLSGFTQFTIEQMPMSSKICLASDAGKTPRMWGLEKLVYRDVKRAPRRDRKYAIQPRNVFATGVHMSQNVAGRTLHKTERRIKYFHYHGTIAERHDPCRVFVNTTEVTLDNTPFVRDDALRRIAGVVKRFELATIGRRLARTRQ